MDFCYATCLKMKKYSYRIIISGIKEDIEAFISHILSENLIEDCSQPNLNEVKLPSDYLRNKWVSPNLIEFSDLQDLILVDPVHDASLQGWPVERP